MKHADILEPITEHTLSEAELSLVHGGSSAGSGPLAPQPPVDTSHIAAPEPPVFRKPLPGETTPPIFPFPTA